MRACAEDTFVSFFRVKMEEIRVNLHHKLLDVFARILVDFLGRKFLLFLLFLFLFIFSLVCILSSFRVFLIIFGITCILTKVLFRRCCISILNFLFPKVTHRIFSAIFGVLIVCIILLKFFIKNGFLLIGLGGCLLRFLSS